MYIEPFNNERSKDLKNFKDLEANMWRTTKFTEMLSQS